MKNGSIVSTDLTSHHAKELKEFYQQVIGWESEDLAMKDEFGVYSDYVRKDKEGNWVGGLCHSRGANKDLPSQWIVYIQVDNVAEMQGIGREGSKRGKRRGGTVPICLTGRPIWCCTGDNTRQLTMSC